MPDNRSISVRRTTALAGLLALAACADASLQEQTAGMPPYQIKPAAGPARIQDPLIIEAETIVAAGAEQDRERHAELTFEEFSATVYKEPFEGGKYLVDGDTTIADLKHLQDFFETRVKANESVRLAVNTIGGLDDSWNSVEKRQLTYCVSDRFGDRHDQVIVAMADAARAWEQVADVDFIYAHAEDDACWQTNSKVMFDIRPVDVGGRYLARAFFPNESRFTRNVLIDQSALDLPWYGQLQLAGILRHEGRALGFRHEHTRVSANRCFEDENWRPLTNYDPFSVMHYPQCDGLGDWSLTLTEVDRNGAACLYGPAAGFAIDPALCLEPANDDDGPIPAAPITVTFADQAVERREEARYGPFRVAGSTIFEARMTPAVSRAGDPDLYVRFDAEPSRFQYDCRPFLTGADERCAVDVPADATEAYVMVRGYQRGRYDLRVTHTPPAPLTAALQVEGR